MSVLKNLVGGLDDLVVIRMPCDYRSDCRVYVFGEKELVLYKDENNRSVASEVNSCPDKEGTPYYDCLMRLYGWQTKEIVAASKDLFLKTMDPLEGIGKHPNGI